MKKILRIVAVEFAGLYVANLVASGLVFKDGIQGVIITSVALGVAMYLVKPIINLLLFPLNMATLGLFRIFGHAITLFLVDVAVTQFEIVGFHFQGLSTQYFDLPAINYDRGPLAYFAFSLVIWFATGIINWLRK